MSTELLIASHLRLAKEDFDAFALLLKQNNRNAVYHAEQVVEHLILALAQSEGIHYQRSQHHQLDTMARALPDENSFKATVLKLGWLEAYSTAYRYPRTKGGISAAPPRQKLEEASIEMKQLVEALAEYFSVDTNLRLETPAAHARPPR